MVDGDYFLDGLNQAQLAAVTSEDPTVVVLAAAGSGKTRVLTRRIAWRIGRGAISPNRVLALTFTRRAAEELRYRQYRLGQRDTVHAGTFHSIALTQLKMLWSEKSRLPPKILDNKSRLIAQVAKKVGVNAGSKKGAGRPADIAAEIDWAQARLIRPADYPNAAALAERTPPVDAEKMAQVMLAYEQEKRQRKVVDFDDLLVAAISSMRQDPTYAAAVRWRYNHIFVDEFQDINPLQYELLCEWRKECDDIFIVGDPNQAIYGWNGADPQLLNRFAEREPDANTITLSENYRSTPHILTLARTVLTNEASAPSTQRTDGEIPTIHRLDDEEAEANHIVEMVRHEHNFGDRWADQAVLTRTNSQLQTLADALNQAGIPARRRTADGPLRNPAVRTELSALTKPNADLRAWVEQTQSLLAEPRDGLPAVARTARSHLAGLLRLVEEYIETNDTADGPGLSDWIGVLNHDDVTSDEDSVDLLTFHSCKGLEWPVVHIAGLEDGFVPIAYAINGEQRNEEMRLLYVALTRAEERLHLTWAGRRSFGGKSSARKPSPYLGELHAAVAQCRSDQSRRPGWRANLATSRQALEHNDQPAVATPLDDQQAPDILRRNSARLKKLTTWRSGRARAAGIEADAILGSSVLEAIVRELADLETAAPHVSAVELFDRVPDFRAAQRLRYGDAIFELLDPKEA